MNSATSEAILVTWLLADLNFGYRPILVNGRIVVARIPISDATSSEMVA